MSENEYLTAAEAARRLGISLRTVRRRIADGTLPAVRIGGAVRVRLGPAQDPAAALHGRASETAAGYGGDAATVPWSVGHWPDSPPALLERRSRAFDALARIREETVASWPAWSEVLDDVRTTFGERPLGERR